MLNRIAYINWLSVISHVGVFTFAIAGALKARTFNMDIFGATVLSFVTAYGGGTVRDILLGVKPVNWLNDNIALALTAAAILIVFLLNRNIMRFSRYIFISDAMGLGLFTAVGIRISIQYGANDFYALIMGIITASFGGLVADIISNTVPVLMKKGELYATASLAGGVLYVLMRKFGFMEDVNMFVCVGSVVLVRVISKKRGISLPEI